MRKLALVIGVFGVFTAAAWAASPSASGTNVMLTGQILRSANGDYLVSSNKAFVLLMQKDGNLCEYFGSSASNFKPGAIWCTNTKGTGERFSVQMHYTNNFCVTTGDEWGQGPALWCTNQVGSGSGPAFALLSDDGNFAIHQGTLAAPGVLLWQNGKRLSEVKPSSFGIVISDLTQSQFAVPATVASPFGSVPSVEGLEQGSRRIKITKPFTSTKDFINWRQSVIDGRTQKHTVTITAFDSSGGVLARYTLANAWPVKYYGPSLNARNSANVFEAIEVEGDPLTVER